MTPEKVLQQAYQTAENQRHTAMIHDATLYEAVNVVVRNIQNRAGVRLVLACLLAKAHHPAVDIRKPYTQIGDTDAYSGRTYDEQYITPLIHEKQLPCNTTTAFLTPALRNRNTTLTRQTQLVGRPKQVYEAALFILDSVHQGEDANTVLVEVLRQLIQLRDENQARLQSLLDAIQTVQTDSVLSAEDIVALIEQHLASKGTSRLPVLIVAAIYQTLVPMLSEQAGTLAAHQAADSQTRLLGDIQIFSTKDQKLLTVYEMKARKMTQTDVDIVLEKIGQAQIPIQNFIFITTEPIDHVLQNHVKKIYNETGTEIAILDCVTFLRHFLHLFFRLRQDFLEHYQMLVLHEPDSAVSQPLKELFLTLRQAAESDTTS